MWQSTDEALLAEATKGTTIARSTQTSTNTLSPSTSLTASEGLSIGAKAGIGVGAAIVVLLALMIGWLVLRKRKRHSERESLHKLPVPRELDAERSNVVEAAPGEPPELYSQTRRPVHELPS
jgi:hypothetical protein